MRRSAPLTATASTHRVPDDATGESRVPARGRYDEAARRERLRWLLERTGADLSPLAEMRLVAERLSANVENAIGAVEIPVGLAGPLLFEGEAARGILHAPFATTEGALVASACRGATAITRAGGVRTRVLAQRMTRAPAFEFATLADACDFVQWLGDRIDDLRERVREVSSHAVLQSVDTILAGSVAHALFVYETGDAAGQNMTTATTWHACQWILRELASRGRPPRRFLIEGNASSDKKVNLRPIGEGRGCLVEAECVVDDATLRRTLKLSARDLLAAFAIVRRGGEEAELVSQNVNVANAVAAIFTATGQDIACVHESSLGHLELQPHPSGVRARLVMPNLVVGTVGGGTHLPAQRALLEVMGCTGPGSARRLAEIIAGFALALDLSTLSAVATGEFASAHERLGRNRPVRPLAASELGPSFFDRAVRRALGSDAARVREVEVLDSGEGASILSALTARRIGKMVGLLHRRLHHDAGHLDVVVKVKPLDAEVILMVQGMASLCGARVAEAHARFRGETGFAACHTRELAVYSQRDPRFTAHAPAVYDIVRDDARETHALVLERLGPDVRLVDSADDPSGWRAADIEAALRGIGAMHAIWMGRERELCDASWIGRPPDRESMATMRPLWEALALHAAEEFPSLFSTDDMRLQRELIGTIPDWWRRIEGMPRTLVHGDFNPRNVAIRETADGPRLCAYDWELATVHLPQRDAAELLAFVLGTDATRAEVAHHVELHRRALAEAGGAVPDAATWRAGFALALRDLLVGRFAMYLMAHTFRRYGFLERSLRTLRHLIALDLEHA